jgi:tRNA threonylcarbamoyladenosine biosynthesis protein TsaE
MIIEIKGEGEMRAFGVKLGAFLRGGEVIELVGDVGAGKTSLTKGIAAGLGVDEDVQSPSFTISRVYETPQHLYLAHYDFYRLHDAGVMANELKEAVGDPHNITVVEWADIVKGVLPADRLSVHITPTAEHERRLEIKAGGEISQGILRKLEK